MKPYIFDSETFNEHNVYVSKFDKIKATDSGNYALQEKSEPQ